MGLTMKSSRKLLEKTIDYAGLFPPASHDMETAWSKFLEYREGKDSWLLSHFICPAPKLRELANFAGKSGKTEVPVPLSVLAHRSDNKPEFLANQRKAMTFTNSFLLSKESNSFAIDMFETNFPPFILESSDQKSILQLLSTVDGLLTGTFSKPVNVFYELTLNDLWIDSADILIPAIAEFNESLRLKTRLNNFNKVGLKIRFGGETVDEVPPIYQVGTIISMCRDFSVPMKATAGLHNPLRHFNKQNNCMMHGFLNLIAAIILANTQNLDEEQITNILAEVDGTSFIFKDTSFKWHDYEASINQIIKGREAAFASFGSCSFTVPQTDLDALGLI